MLLGCGAEVNARAALDQSGVGGQTPIFHAVTQFNDVGLAVVGLLLERGADLSIRAKLPGHYERPDERAESTPLGYASRFSRSCSSRPQPEDLRSAPRTRGAGITIDVSVEIVLDETC